MFLRRQRRFGRSRRILLQALFCLVLFVLLRDLLILLPHDVSQTAEELYLPEKERVFIVSTHWNNEIILRSHWNDAVLNLVEDLGVDNVYVSVYESGSWDDSKGALTALDAQLAEIGAQRTIILDNSTHADEIAREPAATGWIQTPKETTEVRRIPYLSRLRNKSLEPLAELASKGVVYDKVLFLNDVVFTTEDVMHLLSTRDGSYAAACSMDFSKPPLYYDTFALRDIDGEKPYTQTWPYFGSKLSRNALMAGQAVPVQSCWNGMAIFDATPFYNNSTIGLQFRGIPDTLASHHLEGSECCLIHADNALTSGKGAWLNPNVRVGYNPEAYIAVNSGSWPGPYARLAGIWRNRLARWTSMRWFDRRIVGKRLETWKTEAVDNHEPGWFCLINEMQILVANGWAHA